jgi:hypothetical protein
MTSTTNPTYSDGRPMYADVAALLAEDCDSPHANLDTRQKVR